MRTLELTHGEFELVTSALNVTYNKHLELVSTARGLYADIDVSGLLERTEEIGKLLADIASGHKDV